MLRADDARVNQSSANLGRLSTGPIRRWVKGKPRLAASASLAGLPEVKASSAFGHNLGVFLRALVVLVILVVVLGVASWVILALTVLATPTVSGTVWGVQRASWIVGEAPIGSVTAALPQAASTDVLGRLSEVFTGYPQSYIAEVVAKPGSKIETKLNGSLVVDGKVTQFSFSSGIAPTQLQDAYLGVCLEGPCGKVGGPVFIPVKNSLGKVLSGVGLSGVSAPPSLPVSVGSSRG